MLRATILATDVNTPDSYDVTVYDATQTPDETAALPFRVVEYVYRVLLPIILAG
jgi:hypothetical protein